MTTPKAEKFAARKFRWVGTLPGAGLSHRALKAAMVLTNLFNEAREGAAYPSMAYLAAEMAVSKNTARDAVADLERAGWVTIERSKGRSANRIFMAFGQAVQHSNAPPQDWSVEERSNAPEFTRSGAFNAPTCLDPIQLKEAVKGGPAPQAGAVPSTVAPDASEEIPAPHAGSKPAGASIDVFDDGMPDCPRRPPPTEEEDDAEWLRRHREGLEEERREAARAAGFEARVDEDDKNQDDRDEFDRLGIPPAAADRARAMWSMLRGGARRTEYESKIATAMRTDPQPEVFLRRQLAIVAALVGLTHPRFVGQQIAESLERGIRSKLAATPPADRLDRIASPPPPRRREIAAHG